MVLSANFKLLPALRNIDQDYYPICRAGFANCLKGAAANCDHTPLNGGLRSVGNDYNYRHYLSENWQIRGEALFEYFGGEVRDRPIARSDYEAEIGIGFIYLF